MGKIREYRIPMPLTVEEYQLAQLYMTAKKSRMETQDQEGAGVEVCHHRTNILRTEQTLSRL